MRSASAIRSRGCPSGSIPIKLISKNVSAFLASTGTTAFNSTATVTVVPGRSEDGSTVKLAA